MAHLRLKDIDALISAGAGNADVLAQIRRAMKRGEVIAATEHAYVQKLIDEHLGPKPKRAPSARPAESTAELPAQRRAPQEFVGSIVEPGQKRRGAGRISGILRWRRAGPRKAAAPGRRRRRPSGKKLVLFVLIAIVIVAVVAAAVVLGALSYGISSMRLPDGEQAVLAPGPPPLPPGAMIGTDLASYSVGDIILVNGRAEPGASVSLTISGAGAAVWKEEIRAGADGTYSTIVIAGGQGWNAGGTYSVTAAGPSGSHSAEFLFSAG